MDKNKIIKRSKKKDKKVAIKSTKINYQSDFFKIKSLALKNKSKQKKVNMSSSNANSIKMNQKINVSYNNIKNKDRKTKRLKSLKEKSSRNNRNEKMEDNPDTVRSFGDSFLEINKPKKNENYIFDKFNEKKLNISESCQIYLNILKDIDENKKENEIDNKILRYNTNDFSNLKNSRRFQDRQNSVNRNYKINSVQKEKERKSVIDNFFNNNLNNDIYNNGFSNYSLFNNKTNYDFNFKNLYPNDALARNKISFYFNHCINQKIEKIEGDENHVINDFLIEHNFENEIIKDQIKIDNFISVPCINCLNMVNIDEIDEHSNNCFKTEKINKPINDFNNILIDKKLESIYEYLIKEQKQIKINENNNNLELKEKLNFISIITKTIKQILNVNSSNQTSLDKMTQINTSLYKLIEKSNLSNDKCTLLNRIKYLLEEKIKIYKNNISRKSKRNHITFRNQLKKNKTKNNIGSDNSIDELITESETTEFFDLKKMEKILDEKREKKLNNLDNLINEAKNKRLFLMEVLKVKYQKINNNKKGDSIPPQLIWKEAIKNKIEKKNWSNFIYDELNNPNKYLKLKAIKK